MLHPAARVADRGGHAALVMGSDGRTLTYRQLDDASNQVAQLLRDRGMAVGDHVAVLMANGAEWYPITWGAMRAGLYVTPVNWHLAPTESGYIVADCGAKMLVADARFAELLGAMAPDLAGVEVRLAVGGEVDGFERYEDAVQHFPAAPVADECEGAWMLYSSGTTGRPKGIKPPAVGFPLGEASRFSALLMHHFGFEPDMVYLSPAPLYHAAPAGWTAMTQRFGGTVVLMEQFDPHEFLHLIETHQVTHTQVVPTHLIRLLKLPEAERARYDLSSLRTVVHSAAPCPPEVKRAAIEWLGPVVHEMYGGSEGVGLCIIGSEEWLAHPGSVGRSLTGDIHVVGDDGEELSVGEIGQVWFANSNAFEYHNDPDKTAASFRPEGWSTLGDIGRVDDEGYLYLSDRVGNTIISGGVNIYPREIEDVLVGHPAVDDVAVVGRPDPDMGERVVAYVQPAAGFEPGAGFDAELIAWSRERLSHFKCPREVHVVGALPRLPTGKLLKRLLPEPA
jgi:acyl-CoA synthetase (AMP-forming)/AMP-acid ligase II